MDLLNDPILQSLPRLNANGGTDPMAHLKYYGPDSAMIWLAFEVQQERGDCRFWGIRIDPNQSHWIYFTLRELEDIRGPEGERVRRDETFTPRPLSQLMELRDDIILVPDRETGDDVHRHR
jgi:hypothetical protein